MLLGSSPPWCAGLITLSEMPASSDHLSDGQHRAIDTGPVRRWDDNPFGLWMRLRLGHLGLPEVAVLSGLFLVLTAGIMLWPGARTAASDAALYALLAILGLYGLVSLTVLAVSLVWSVAASAVSLVRFLRRR